MSESKLKDLIFLNDSTTLKTLSDLEVTDIAGLSSDIIKLQKENIEFKQQLDSLGAKLQLETDKLSNRINDNTTKIEANVDSIIDLNTKVTNNDIIYKQNFDDINGKLSDTSSKLVSLTENVSNLQNTVNGIGDQVVALDDKVNTFESKISDLETNITKNSEQISLLESKVDTFGTKIENLEASTANLEYRTDNILDAVNKNIVLLRQHSDELFVLNKSVYEFPSEVIGGMGIIDKNILYQSTVESVVRSGEINWYVPDDIVHKTLTWNINYPVNFQFTGGNWLSGTIKFESNSDKMRAGDNKGFMGIANFNKFVITYGSTYTSYNITKAIENVKDIK